jgi:hypothetical protein
MEKIEGYTPGPWGVGKTNNLLVFSTQGQVAHCGTDGAKDNLGADECVSNAALMAMAPTLYEENARLKSENERLREALKPFADEVSNWAADARPGHDAVRPILRARDLVRARAALGEAE